MSRIVAQVAITPQMRSLISVLPDRNHRLRRHAILRRWYCLPHGSYPDRLVNNWIKKKVLISIDQDFDQFILNRSHEAVRYVEAAAELERSERLLASMRSKATTREGFGPDKESTHG